MSAGCTIVCVKLVQEATRSQEAGFTQPLGEKYALLSRAERGTKWIILYPSLFLPCPGYSLAPFFFVLFACYENPLTRIIFPPSSFHHLRRLFRSHEESILALVPWLLCPPVRDSLLMLSFHGPFFPPSLPFVVRSHISPSDILFLKHDRSIVRQSSNLVCGFFMLEQVSLCGVWPVENWLGFPMNHIQGWLSENAAGMLEKKDVCSPSESWVLPSRVGSVYCHHRFSPIGKLTKFLAREKFVHYCLFHWR